MKTSITLSILAMLMATGCGVVKVAPSKSQSQPSATTKSPVTSPSLPEQRTTALDGEWAVVSVDGQQIEVDGDNYPSIIFTPSPTMNSVADIIAFNGCNYLNGSWQIDGNKLKDAGELISTLKACADAPYEYQINKALNNAASFAIENDGSHKLLTLNNVTGSPLMTLRRHSLSNLNGEWKVTMIAGMPVTDAVDLRMVIDSEQGSIHGNAGCNVLNGKMLPTLEKPDGLEFRDLHTTRMTCPYIETEQAFLLALEEVVTVKVSGHEASLLNEEGQPIIEMQKD